MRRFGDWLTEEFEILNFKFRIENGWGIIETDKGYRFWRIR
jgi:hypothetical protein